MTIRIAAIEVSHWHAVYDTGIRPLSKQLTLTRFSRQREVVPII
jgi:hypothetical protein